MRDYIETRLFDQQIAITEPETVKKLNNVEVRERVRDIFVDAIQRLEAVEELYQLSETKPYHTSLAVYRAKKTVFDRLPYPHNSEYERIAREVGVHWQVRTYNQDDWKQVYSSRV